MKIAFLDRDGVINQEIGYLHNIKDFKYTEGCKSALLLLSRIGFKIVIVTNQAGIAKGFYSVAQYYELTAWMLDDLQKSGIVLLECLFCPHHPDGVVDALSIPCNCRKPKSGMLEYVISKYDVDLAQSIMVGDKVSDMEAGENVGIPALYLVKSGHAVSGLDDRAFPTYENLFELATDLSESIKINRIN